MSPVGPLPPSVAAGVAAEASKTAEAKPAPDDKTLHQQKEAARQFESIFLRQMLSSLEKTNKMGQSGESKGDGSGGIYGSMMVSSLADSISQSGGIGLADVILRALQGTHPGPGAPKK